MTAGGKRKTPPQPQPEPMEEEEPSSASEDEDLSGDEGTKVDGIYIPPAQPPTLSMDPTGPRLIITKITNNFFKSYAENQVLGPFSKVVFFPPLVLHSLMLALAVFQCNSRSKR